MNLSVVIPTYNRADRVLETLRAIEAQTLSREDFEVIVVDDGSEEEHRVRLRAYEAPFPCTIVEKENGGLANSRNVGAKRATGDVLCFLDDDVLPAPETLAEHLASHRESDTPRAVVGSLPYPEGLRLTAFLWYLDKSGHYDLYEHGARKYPGGIPPLPPMNGNSSVRRETFFDLGAYDETFRQYGGEDLELGYRLQRAGVEFVYNPRAVGYHNHVKDFAHFCVDMERAGESLIWMYRKYPEIKAAKKIDVVEDPIGTLPGKKKVMKAILATTAACPWLLALPRVVARAAEPVYGLRHALFPLFRWVAFYHYALGMQRGLEETA